MRRTPWWKIHLPLVIQERGAVAGSGGMAGPPGDEELEHAWVLPASGRGHVWG